MFSTITRCVLRGLAALLVSVLVCAPASALAVGIDDYADYEPQTRCTSTTQPGTAFLVKWLARKYPDTGGSSTLRPCSSGGTSEHKDGRALDWSVDADRPAQRATAESFLTRIFATSAAGHQHAMARRTGIMYLIWDDQMWASYRQFEGRDYLHSGCQTVDNCSKTLRHRDHVHISLSHAGAAAETSFYTKRNVPTAPLAAE